VRSIDHLTNHRDTKFESTVTSESNPDNSNEDGPDDTVIRNSESTSPETCRAGIDD